jgi:hypothetical protein
MKASAVMTVIVIRQRLVAIPAFLTQHPQIPTRFSHTRRERSTKIRVGFPLTSTAVPTNTQRDLLPSNNEVLVIAQTAQVHDSSQWIALLRDAQ